MGQELGRWILEVDTSILLFSLSRLTYQISVVNLDIIHVYDFRLVARDVNYSGRINEKTTIFSVQGQVSLEIVKIS